MVLKNLKVNSNTTSVRDIETCPPEPIMKNNSLNMLIMKMIFLPRHSRFEYVIWNRPKETT